MDSGLQLFTMGIWVIALAYLTSAIGVFVGVTSARKVRTASTDRVRLWWLIIAALVSGGVGVWLSQFLPMAGFGVEGTPIRYDVAMIAFSVIVALVAVFVALLVALPAYGRRTTARTVMGALVLGAGLVAVHFCIMWSVRMQGSITHDPWFVSAAVVLASVTAVAFMWQVTMADTWPKRLVSSAVAAAAVIGVRYLGLAAVQVEMDATIVQPAGIEVFSILFPLFVIGLLFLAVPIVAVLMAPDRVAAQLESESERWVTDHTSSPGVGLVS